jgi:serine/threonine protein kinase
MQPEASGTEQALEPGTVLDAYEIQGILGIGGFGITYAARDTNLDRQVAIKEYFPNALAVRGDDGSSLLARSKVDVDSYDWGLRRFLDEARTLAKFHNQYIVRVNRYMQANQTAYLVMDYEDGLPLSDVLARRQLDEKRVRKVLAAILLGLRVVHAESFLHRDVKPANIFLRRKGPPLLLDFGAAREALQARAAQDMTVIVTPGFAPLEQYGDGDALGPWSDLYALGATAYFAMVGKPPRDAAWRMQAVASQLDDPVRLTLESLGDSYSEDLRALVGWMMQPLAKDRPQHCDDVLGALNIPGLSVNSRSQSVRIPSGMTSLSMSPTQTGLSSSTVAPTMFTGVPGQGTPAAPAAVSDEEKSLAVSLLADYVGPIAKVLVRKAAAGAMSRQAFIDALAGEVDDDDVRAAFIKAFIKH